MSLAEALVEQGVRGIACCPEEFPIERRVAGYRYVQLPPARAVEQDFTRLVDAQGKAVDDDWRRERRESLLQQVREFMPDLLITETFPFGRRQFRFELEPLISWAQEQPALKLVASVRDVLQQRSAIRNRQTVDTVKQFYDAVLVHADEALFRLDASFPLSHEIEDYLFYTGYMYQQDSGMTEPERRAHARSDREGEGWHEVIVSGEAARSAPGCWRLRRAPDHSARHTTGSGDYYRAATLQLRP